MSRYTIKWKYNGETQISFCNFGGIDNKEAIYKSPPGIISISHGNIPISISEDNNNFIILKPRCGTEILPDMINQYLDKGISSWWLKIDSGKYFTINLDRSSRQVELFVSNF
jgi:hypothetical protein